MLKCAAAHSATKTQTNPNKPGGFRYMHFSRKSVRRPRATSHIERATTRCTSSLLPSTMADSVQYALDRMVVDLEDLRYRGIFSEVRERGTERRRDKLLW